MNDNIDPSKRFPTPRRVTVINEYETHHYVLDLVSTNFYCPNCGERWSIWVEDDPGDYYLGPNYYCIECLYVFSLCASGCRGEQRIENIVKQIKKGKSDSPTTPKGH